MFKKIYEWIVFSSANPKNISLTIKSVIPFLVLLNLGDEVQLNTISDSIVEAVVLLGQVVTGAVAFFAVSRKIFFSVFPAKK